MLVLANECQQVGSQNLKDHTYVGTMRPLMREPIVEFHNKLASWVVCVCCDNLVKQLDFVKSGFNVMLGRFHDLQGTNTLALGVETQPYS